MMSYVSVYLPCSFYNVLIKTESLLQSTLQTNTTGQRHWVPLPFSTITWLCCTLYQFSYHYIHDIRSLFVSHVDIFLRDSISWLFVNPSHAAIVLPMWKSSFVSYKQYLYPKKYLNNTSHICSYYSAFNKHIVTYYVTKLPLTKLP